MNINRKTIIPGEVQYTILTVDLSFMRTQVETEPLQYTDVIRIVNHLNYDIIMINEYEVPTLISSPPNKPVKSMEIIFKNSKLPIKNQNGKALSITLTNDHFKPFKSVYIPELNVVFTSKEIYETYLVRHPFPVFNYKDILDRSINKLIEEINPLGFVWYINEPNKSLKEYYMTFGNEVVKLGKTHFQDKGTSFTVMAPRSDLCLEDRYDSKITYIEKLDSTEVKEVNVSFGRNKFTFLLSVNKELLYQKIEEKNKVKVSSVLKSDHDKIVEALKEKHGTDLNKLKEEHQNKIEKLLKEFNEKVAILEKERDNLQAFLDATNNANKAYSNYHKYESDKYTAHAKMESAKNATNKERLALLGDFIKYGLGGLVTLITILVAQKAASK